MEYRNFIELVQKKMPDNKLLSLSIRHFTLTVQLNLFNGSKLLNYQTLKARKELFHPGANILRKRVAGASNSKPIFTMKYHIIF